MGTENDFENLDLLNDQGEVGGLNGGDVEVDLPVLLAFLDEVWGYWLAATLGQIPPVWGNITLFKYLTHHYNLF